MLFTICFDTLKHDYMNQFGSGDLFSKIKLIYIFDSFDKEDFKFL